MWPPLHIKNFLTRSMVEMILRSRGLQNNVQVFHSQVQENRECMDGAWFKPLGVCMELGPNRWVQGVNQTMTNNPW